MESYQLVHKGKTYNIINHKPRNQWREDEAEFLERSGLAGNRLTVYRYGNKMAKVKGGGWDCFWGCPRPEWEVGNDVYEEHSVGDQWVGGPGLHSAPLTDFMRSENWDWNVLEELVLLEMNVDYFLQAIDSPSNVEIKASRFKVLDKMKGDKDIRSFAKQIRPAPSLAQCQKAANEANNWQDVIDIFRG